MHIHPKEKKKNKEVNNTAKTNFTIIGHTIGNKRSDYQSQRKHAFVNSQRTRLTQEQK